jgi:transcription-repair coupling factor (superfamily II helicase)
MVSTAPHKSLAPLLSRLADSYPFAKVQANIIAKRLDLIAPQGSHAAIAATVSELRAEAKKADKLGRVQLIVVATGREGEDTAAALRALDPTAEILEFASWETLPHERLSPSPETVGKRLKVLHRLHELGGGSGTAEHPAQPQSSFLPELDHNVYVVASVRAVLQPVVAGLADFPPLVFKTGKDYMLPLIGVKLVELAYHRVDMVTKRGEFAVRGGIVDIFPTTAEHAVRLEFFGDELEEIRQFSVSDQRTLVEAENGGKLPSVTIYPAREIIITPSVAQRARQMLHEFPNLSTMLAKITEGIPVEGMESLAPVLTDAMVPFTDYLPTDALITLLSPEKSAARAASLVETNEEFLHAAWDAAIAGADRDENSERAPIDLSSGGFVSLGEFTGKLAGRQLFTVSQFGADDDTLHNLGLLDIPNFKAVDASVTDWIADQAKNGQLVVVSSEGHGMAERIAEQLAMSRIEAKFTEELPTKPAAKTVYVLQTPLRRGFAAPEAKLIVLTEHEFYGKSNAYISPAVRKMAAKRGQMVDPLTLKAGDYVVHEIHGIGRFVEMIQRRSGAGGGSHMREFLVVEFAPSKRGAPADNLYVPTDQLDYITKYVGGEAPVLSKMGGSDWAQTKGKARKAVRKIAVDLVKLYSARVKSKGYAFGPDTAWQREMEEAFNYVENPDQLQTIDEIKRDMERPVPMDRLLAGDVGYGKTEVALRAAFKAIQDGKQVAMLVPTTLLVRQHVETLHERFSGFPVRVEALSRFQTDKEAKKIIEGLETGAVDMVVGTHRLLSGSVKFKDLGLIIVDEEQRFGVEHKEKLKEFRANVDVLSMSATPIPRTLEMAITGIREMSTLATPPEERHPILTYIGGYSDKQVAAAIRRELIREGQVFFVHNRVSSIEKVAKDLAELVPEARIAVAHGQMSEHALEQVVVDFWERRFDVLISTTIIETGIDIPNANTLIIDRAENFGLSQLHQIRGRVGRGRDRAYAYFFYDPSKPLTETAHDRLATIAANNELGSGMQVALKDLEIRGAGNLLGGEQSGHIAGVGFDLYLRMIGDAVAEFKGETREAPAELKLELPVDAHIPNTYVDSDRLRLEAYHKLSAASGEKGTRAQLEAILAELEDRYGPAPDSVKTLIAVTELRQQANRLGLKDLNALGNQVKLSPVELTETDQVRLSHLFPGLRYLASSKLMTVPTPVVRVNKAVQGDDGVTAAFDEPLRDQAMIDWVWAFLARVFPPQAK